LRPAFRGRYAHRGAILIMTLWTVSILALFVVGLAYRMGLLLKVTGYQRDQKVVRQVALGGIRWAQGQLLGDDNTFDSLYACGITYTTRESLKKIFNHQALGQGTFSLIYELGTGQDSRTFYGMQDEERKININQAPLAVLVELPGMNEDLASAIIDWRDENQEPLLDGLGNEKPFGAEDEQYSEFPYQSKDSLFQAIEELKLVKGMTDEVYHEISSFVTVYGEGKVNINTAPPEVLIALAREAYHEVGGVERNIDRLVDQIIDQRDGLDDVEGTADDAPFYNVRSQMREMLLGTEERRLLEKMIDHYLIVTSSVFRIQCWGELKKRKRGYRIETVIERIEDGRELKTLYWKESAS
jgi:general secretion pathway protein K